MLNRFETVRLAVVCSQRAPGIETLLHHPQRRHLYDVACVITSEETLPGRAAIEDAGVPVLVHPIRRFHRECGTSLRDMNTRRAYDALTVHVLQQLDVTAVLFLGYLYVASETMLAAFPERILNIHDSDLTLKGPDGLPKYTGLHSTRAAIMAGEKETRSSVHFVTEQLDAGPILLRSGPYPVAPFAHDACAEARWEVVRAYAFAQREWMMHDAWGDLAVGSIELLSAGVGAGSLEAAV